jgi:hypothetical protein
MVEDARKLGGEALDVCVRECDPRQPGDMEDFFGRE